MCRQVIHCSPRLHVGTVEKLLLGEFECCFQACRWGTDTHFDSIMSHGNHLSTIGAMPVFEQTDVDVWWWTVIPATKGQICWNEPAFLAWY